MERALRRRLDPIFALLVLTASGVLGIALTRGALGEAVTVFLVGALVVQFVRSVGLFPADAESEP